jgi:hypothetical protein
LPTNDDHAVSASDGAPAADQGRILLALYDRALPQVYGYLVSRAGARLSPRT